MPPVIEKIENEKEPEQRRKEITTKDLIWWGLTAISICLSAVFLVQNFYLSREYDRLDHRFDVGDAYFNKALIDRRKQLESGYLNERRQNEKLREHCKLNPCNLSPELSIALSEVKFEPLDKILPKKKGEQKDEH
jgi:hypothetical protein